MDQVSFLEFGDLPESECAKIRNILFEAPEDKLGEEQSVTSEHSDTASRSSTPASTSAAPPSTETAPEQADLWTAAPQSAAVNDSARAEFGLNKEISSATVPTARFVPERQDMTAPHRMSGQQANAYFNTAPSTGMDQMNIEHYRPSFSHPSTNEGFTNCANARSMPETSYFPQSTPDPMMHTAVVTGQHSYQHGNNNRSSRQHAHAVPLSSHLHPNASSTLQASAKVFVPGKPVHSFTTPPHHSNDGLYMVNQQRFSAPFNSHNAEYSIGGSTGVHANQSQNDYGATGYGQGKNVAGTYPGSRHRSNLPHGSNSNAHTGYQMPPRGRRRSPGDARMQQQASIAPAGPSLLPTPLTGQQPGFAGSGIISPGAAGISPAGVGISPAGVSGMNAAIGSLQPNCYGTTYVPVPSMVPNAVGHTLYSTQQHHQMTSSPGGRGNWRPAKHQLPNQQRTHSSPKSNNQSKRQYSHQPEVRHGGSQSGGNLRPSQPPNNVHGRRMSFSDSPVETQGSVTDSGASDQSRAELQSTKATIGQVRAPEDTLHPAGVPELQSDDSVPASGLPTIPEPTQVETSSVDSAVVTAGLSATAVNEVEVSTSTLSTSTLSTSTLSEDSGQVTELVQGKSVDCPVEAKQSRPAATSVLSATTNSRSGEESDTVSAITFGDFDECPVSDQAKVCEPTPSPIVCDPVASVQPPAASAPSHVSSSSLSALSPAPIPVSAPTKAPTPPPVSTPSRSPTPPETSLAPSHVPAPAPAKRAWCIPGGSVGLFKTSSSSTTSVAASAAQAVRPSTVQAASKTGSASHVSKQPSAPGTVRPATVGASGSVAEGDIPAAQTGVCAANSEGWEDEPQMTNGSGLEHKLKEILSDFPDWSDASISHHLSNLVPRGLTNRGNWCYVNATLQALLACPPFANFFKSLLAHPQLELDGSTPILNSLLSLQKEFCAMKLPQKVTGWMDLKIPVPVDPRSVLDMLKDSKQGFQSGKQEDAEEFLTFLLNGLHDELVSTMEVEEKDSADASASMNGAADSTASGPGPEEEEEGGDGDGWDVVERKKKAGIPRRTEQSKSYVAAIFGGTTRSTLTQRGAKDSATLTPFFSIALSIQSPTINSVEDALKAYVSSETIDGVICSKTNKKMERTTRLQFEELPVVLVLHLKYFEYVTQPDGSASTQKLKKIVRYSDSLTIDQELLSPVAKGKIDPSRLGYKLFAVVCHRGPKPTNGHYVTYAYHVGRLSWGQYNDGLVKGVHLSTVLNPSSKHDEIPYLLFYRRMAPRQAGRGAPGRNVPSAAASTSSASAH